MNKRFMGLKFILFPQRPTKARRTKTSANAGKTNDTKPLTDTAPDKTSGKETDVTLVGSV